MKSESEIQKHEVQADSDRRRIQELNGIIDSTDLSRHPGTSKGDTGLWDFGSLHLGGARVDCSSSPTTIPRHPPFVLRNVILPILVASMVDGCVALTTTRPT